LLEPKCPIDPNEYIDLHLDMLKLIQYDEIKHCNLNKDVIDILSRLNWYCIILTQSCMELIWPGLVWQAEILERSLLEATIKLIYISIDKSKIDQKADEFQNVISDINHYKRRKDMLEFLDGVNINNDITKHSFQNVTKYNVEMKFNKKERNKILEKWTFNSMTKEIDTYKIDGFDKLEYFKNYYANTSHYIHVDIDCLDLIWDRDNRGDIEKSAMTLAHMGRELEDLYTFNAMRTYSLLRLYDIDKSVLPKYIESKKSIINKISSLNKNGKIFIKNIIYKKKAVRRHDKHTRRRINTIIRNPTLIMSNNACR
jgi:hypothetical protein